MMAVAPTARLGASTTIRATGRRAGGPSCASGEKRPLPAAPAACLPPPYLPPFLHPTLPLPPLLPLPLPLAPSLSFPLPLSLALSLSLSFALSLSLSLSPSFSLSLPLALSFHSSFLSWAYRVARRAKRQQVRRGRAHEST